MLPPPAGIWGMPPEMLETVPGYGPDVQKNRAEARAIMQKLGYGPDKRLEVTVSTRDVCDVSRPGDYLDRSAEGHLHRRCARHGRDRQLAHQGDPRRLCGGAQCHRQRCRRPGSTI